MPEAPRKRNPEPIRTPEVLRRAPPPKGGKTTERPTADASSKAESPNAIASTAAASSVPPVASLPAEAASAASGPDRIGTSLLDTEASRQAIRESARTVTLGERLAASREEPRRIGPQQRLGNAVEAGGKGDCAKGDYPGGGMGLLSVPFLAAAVITGNCAK